MKTGIHPRHLLRLGHGEKDLTLRDFYEYSKIGRVNWCLSRRQELLTQVQRLASSLNIVGDVGSSCETATYFEIEHIHTRIKKFNVELQNLKTSAEAISVGEIFPFSNYFTELKFTGNIYKSRH